MSGNPIINSVDASQDEAHAKQLSEENEQLKAEVQRLKKALRDPSA